MNCPICGKPAKTPRGLRSHLTGTRTYSGHELTQEEAAFTVAGIISLDPSADVDADSYLETALKLLVQNKKLPKYQFERSVDAFLGVFLPEIVELLGNEGPGVTLVAQEFPLKKDGSNMSTNVDYVLHAPSARERPWIFLELKTDVSSMKDSHAPTYAKLVNTPMESLLKDVDTIASAAQKKSKYEALIARFKDLPTLGAIRFAYLVPKKVDTAWLFPTESSPDVIAAFDALVDIWTFADLASIQLETYPDAWALFTKYVLPDVVARLSKKSTMR